MYTTVVHVASYVCTYDVTGYSLHILSVGRYDGEYGLCVERRSHPKYVQSTR
jgi:hypothetical protein